MRAPPPEKGRAIDWLCFPRFDSGAVFSALLGTKQHGRWLFAPEGRIVAARRRYEGDNLVLQTDMETADGSVPWISAGSPAMARSSQCRQSR